MLNDVNGQMMTARRATTLTMMAFVATGDNNDGEGATTTTLTMTTMATGRRATKLTMMAPLQWTATTMVKATARQ
jgi:hypothetical protein